MYLRLCGGRLQGMLLAQEEHALRDEAEARMAVRSID